MIKKILQVLCLVLTTHSLCVAQTREELERQRQQLRKEMEETQTLLNETKAKTKENLVQYNLIKRKVDLQGRVIDNIRDEINILDGNMYLITKDIRRYNRILDTMKQEYAKSMVYAYKNRGNIDFLNFIFSAGSFNDAIRRINYLRSYREYREMQGQNILRMQGLRKKKMEDLNEVKGEKKTVLNVQSKEMNTLQTERKEKDRIIAELKKKGNQLNKQIAAKQKQLQKVNNAIAAAIKKAQEEARKEALARAAAEKAKLDASKKDKPAGEKDTKERVEKPTRTIPKKESILLNDGNTALNSSFERNRGALPWPVDKGWVMMRYGSNTLPSGSVIENNSITISSDIGLQVKAVFDGVVSAIAQVDGMTVVIIQHGRYFSSYSNLSGVTVKKGQDINTGQIIGRVSPNFDGGGSIDFFISNENNAYYDPEKWLKRK
jgi:septal ring factor EnvC (AmiA/AmiB activator)